MYNETFSTVSASSLIIEGMGKFGGMVLGVDGVNNPTVTVYDNNEASFGNGMIVPTQEFDATELRLNGLLFGDKWINFKKGLYVVISCAGVVRVTIYHTKWV